MAAAPNYHNRQNFSDFASPFSNNPDPMRRNFRFDQKQELRENQKNLESMLEQLKKKDAESNNPFYDNTYKHNLNVRGKPQDLSLDLQNQYPSLSRISEIGPTSMRNERRESFKKPPNEERIQSEVKPMERNEVPSFRDYDKKNSQGNNKGNFFDGFGENSRHKNIVKEYQEYMKNNPVPHPKNRNSEKYEEKETNRISLKKKKDQQNSDWYSKDIGVGILPGMGSNPDRRGGVESQRRQPVPEYNPMQDRQSYDFSEGRKPSGAEEHRRGISDIPIDRAGIDIPNRMSQNYPGSRLAGIGSRILDSERPYFDQMRTPQYTANKDAMRINFATPQNQKESLKMGPNLAERFREMQGYSNDSNRYGKDSYEKEGMMNDNDNFENFRDYKNQPSQDWNAQNEGRWQDFAKQGRQNDKSERGVGNNGNSVSWLEERQKQEQEKKERQREELQRVYREQIEEKKRKKEEEQKRQQQEEKKEEERLRRELDDLQKQFQLEQQKKNEAEEPKKSQVEDDYSAATRRRQNKHKKTFETSSENTMKRDVPVLEPDMEKKPRYEQEDIDMDYMIKEPVQKNDEQFSSKPRYEFSKDPEMEVQREVARKINATLDEQLEKMKRDVDYHAKLLRNGLATYQTQAMVSQELRHNAQKELQRLREDLKYQQVQETRGPIVSSDSHAEKHRGKGYEYGPEKIEGKMNLKLPSKSYAKIYRPEDENQNLELSAAGLTLDFETKYVPAQETTAGYNLFKEPEKLSELMKKYGVDDDHKSPNRNDAAMKKFGALFPSHDKKNQSQGSLDAIEAKLGQLTLVRKEVSNPTEQRGFSYAKGLALTKPKENIVKNSEREEMNAEGEDEIERIESLLKKYRDPDLKDKVEKKPAKINIKSDQLVSNKRIINELENDEFLASGRHLINNYDDGEDNYELKETDEVPGKSERELANDTQEIDITNEVDDIQNEDEQEMNVQQ